MKINAGKMRSTITIQKPSTRGGSLGQTQWEDFATVKAEVKTLTGRELSSIPQLGGSEVSTEIITRYLPGVTAEDRVQFGTGRCFVIKFVNVETEGAPRLTHLYCREIMTA